MMKKQRVINRLSMTTFMVALLSGLLSSCISLGPDKETVKTYDLGVPYAAPAQPLRGNFFLRTFYAVAPIDSTAMLYRLIYADAAQLSAYTESQWRVSPVGLLRKRFELATQFSASQPGDGAMSGRCAVDINLSAFEQRFISATSAEAVLDWTVSVVDMNVRKTLAEKRIVKQVAMESGDAKSGVAALILATDQAIAETITWLNDSVAAQYPDCAAARGPTPR